ncbi:MAG: hypothetical protein F4Z75_07840 [Synechococcus sp. SB0668_bin_15]|nr:hypothetical protein [Synechococcus sp. SB0668_bin_15]MXZ82346.1 hypothetical protein [Synechococcus sp. SB0666_bin_14]MYA90694.1 hypothetical protein [Synechococcus sp. SB0663_bin_10]MYC49060.1 hypothetical protein [Synechococcus sp. SB0662_bin_14]MYG47294.1 hypothetical protein [Synechococcus sp. SB0675_bin_6]MYJ60190.1 hypothetical protein [Synechococcus sp. SB0672_bin_6]MYK92240.1 hypothetical protein [Synechococcus sp. SB0669_bin_8]
MPQKRDEHLLDLLSLGIKLGVILMASISFIKLGAAHHRTRALSRGLEAEYARQQEFLLVARRAFDDLFQIRPGGRAGKWAAPNRQRVVWDSSAHPGAPSTGSP